MQTTDLIGTALSLLGTRLLREGPLLVTREHDRILQLDLTGHSPEYQAVPFFPHPEQALCFGDFLELQARKGVEAIRLIETTEPEEIEGLPARVREGFQGTSHLALAVQLPEHVQIYEPYIHQPACTRLTSQDLLWFLRSLEDPEQIARAFAIQVGEPEAGFEALLATQGECPSRWFFDLLSLVMGFDDVDPGDRVAWQRLVEENHEDIPPVFPHLFEGGFEGRLEGPRPEEVEPGFRQLLGELVGYCEEIGLGGWGLRFSTALRDLDEDDPEIKHPVFRFAQELSPPNHFRLFRACSRAWVFGGPDSWNEVPQAGSERFEEFSERLLHFIKGGILSIANQELEPTASS